MSLKGISGSPVLGAYQRMAVSSVKGAGQVQSAAPVAPSASATTAENAEVKISAKARGLAVDSDSAIDTVKVNDLKSKIAAGDYKIDHLQIASRLIERSS